MGRFRIKKRRRKESGRAVKMTPEITAAMDEQFKRFKAKFGRDPGPEDPVFFDPDADTPREMDMDAVQRQIIEGMGKVGIDPAFIYAYQKTGLMLTTMNEDQLSEEDLAEWDAAIEEYNQKTKGKPQ